MDTTKLSPRPPHRAAPLRLAVGLAATTCAAIAPPAQAQQAMNVAFTMPYLESFQTTEDGADEVYLVVAGRWNDGTGFRYRYPNDTQHWDLNDQEGDPPVLNWPLTNFDGVAPGQSIDLIVSVMEEDGGTTGGWVALGGALIGLVAAPTGAIVSGMSGLLNFQDSDDVLGVFGVHIENRGGQLVSTFRAIDRIYNICDPAGNWMRCPIAMSGDGSNYRSTFSVAPR